MKILSVTLMTGLLAAASTFASCPVNINILDGGSKTLIQQIQESAAEQNYSATFKNGYTYADGLDFVIPSIGYGLVLVPVAADAIRGSTSVTDYEVTLYRDGQFVSSTDVDVRGLRNVKKKLMTASAAQIAAKIIGFLPICPQIKITQQVDKAGS